VDILRLRTSGGPTSVLTSLRVPHLNGLAAGPDGSLYYTENTAIRRISAQGQISTVAANITLTACPSIPGMEPNDAQLRGLAVDASGTVYVAASGCGSVLKVTPGGRITTVLQLESPWSPTAVALFGKDIYVLEYLHTAVEDRLQWLPRVRKIAPDGKTTVIASVTRD
jgi:sugar lactone lactonase YvrE